MDSATFHKYLDFLISESKRYRKSASDTDMISLTVELNKFRERLTDSGIPAGYKDSIDSINFNYTQGKADIGIALIMASVLTLGVAMFFIYYSRKRARQGKLDQLRTELSKIRDRVLLDPELS